MSKIIHKINESSTNSSSDQIYTDNDQIEQKLNDLIIEIYNYTTYADLYNIHLQINLLKMNAIKNEMNKIINDGYFSLEYDDIPLYQNYILSMFTTTHPIIKPHVDQIKKIIQNMDKYLIHPYILQPLFTNIMHSIYISEISTNPESLTNDMINTIAQIQTNVELTMSIFDDIYTKIDTKFKSAEDLIGYNQMSILDDSEQTNIFETFINNISEQNNLENNLKKLHSLIIQIEHMSHYDIINNIDEFNDKYFGYMNNSNSSNILKNKLLYDYDNLSNLKSYYVSYVSSNYNNLIKYNTFAEINNININKFMEKNMIYYWLDHIAFLNGKIFDKMFKHD